jgi:4-amino-4-deoxy-L-arabinose transferase-like glycosyltransferase
MAKNSTPLALIPVGFIFLSTFIFLTTEFLSALSVFTPFNVRALWLIAFTTVSIFLWKKRFFEKLNFSFSFFILSIIPVLTFIQGFLSAPNTTDAMVYHLPRALYWIQEGTAWQREVFTAHDWMPPLSGYFLAHLLMLFGGDSFVFLSQWLAGVVSLVVVWLLTKKLSVQKGVPFWTTLFVSTLPIFAFQMSSTQVDLVTTAFVVCSYWFALEYLQHQRYSQSLLLGLSGGFAVMSKPSAVFWLIPLALLFLIEFVRFRNWRAAAKLIPAAILAGLLQLHWLLQNMQLFGSFLGKHHTSTGEVLQYTNEIISLGVLVSNTARNILLQFPFPIFGNVIESGLESVLNVLGTSLQDPATTWYGATFHLQRIIFPQEDIVASPLHMLIILIGTLGFVVKRKLSVAHTLLFLNWIGFLLFSLAFKWQPYHSRLLMPFLILASVFVCSQVRFQTWMKGIVVLHVLATILLIFANVSHPFISYKPFEQIVRPLMPAQARIPTSIFTTPREEQYFHARPYWHDPYDQMSSHVSGFASVQTKLDDNFFYPLAVMLRAKNPTIRFVTEGAEIVIWSGERSSVTAGSLCFYSTSSNALCDVTSSPGLIQ